MPSLYGSIAVGEFYPGARRLVSTATTRRKSAMKTRAAVASEKAKPLEVMEVDLDGPKAGEVLIEVKATGICHTDDFTLSGADPEGLFPAVLGHEGAGIVVDVGPGVTSVKKGDHVIPLYTPECRQCPSCLSRKIREDAPFDKICSARHGASLERHRLRRRARPHRRAQDRRLVHGGKDPDRSDDHPHDAARRDQQGLHADA